MIESPKVRALRRRIEELEDAAATAATATPRRPLGDTVPIDQIEAAREMGRRHAHSWMPPQPKAPKSTDYANLLHEVRQFNFDPRNLLLLGLPIGQLAYRDGYDTAMAAQLEAEDRKEAIRNAARLPSDAEVAE